MTQLSALNLVDLAASIKAGYISSMEATADSLNRLSTLGAAYNCVVALWKDEAMAAAERADAARRGGNPLGPLHGVPLAHKDLFYVKGRRAEAGSIIRRGYVPDFTATALMRLEHAGAINLGSLHMSEFALSPTGYNKHFGYCRNPWNIAHITGGSSSGSAAAVAARLIPGSLGSDTGGSVRVPAALCGLVGLKPTHSLISRAGVMPLSYSLDCIGPLARTARDCARLLSVVGGQDPDDSRTNASLERDYETGLTDGIRGLRIAVPQGDIYDSVEESVRSVLDESKRVLAGLGAKIVPIDPPDLTSVSELNKLILIVEAAGIHDKWLRQRPNDYSNHVRERLETGLAVPGTHYFNALSLRAKMVSRFVAAAFADADVMFMPCVPMAVPRISQETDGEKGSTVVNEIVKFTRAFNYLGTPALSVPAGFTISGLPAAFQLVGRHFDDGLLLRVAHAYQSATKWHEQMPVEP
jgi:aspartyl-tRNA(Asn)/glutamyl-tRNA(Gln) amidotransferase subunit A